MTLQQSPHRSEADLMPFLKEIDRATELVPAPPLYGSPQRDAINSCVDNVVQDLCGKIDELHKTLEAIKQQVLQNAAKSKHTLVELVGDCVRVNDEISRIKDVVGELARESGRDA